MSDPTSPPGRAGGQPGSKPDVTDGDRDAAALMRAVLREQEKHREGGVDPELAEPGAARGSPGPGAAPESPEPGADPQSSKPGTAPESPEPGADPESREPGIESGPAGPGASPEPGADPQHHRA